MNARDGMKRLRDERRERGVCTMCGLKKPEPGRRLCRECNDRSKAYNAKWRGSHPDKVRENSLNSNMRSKAVREERKARGVCIRCGVNKPYGWRVTCISCLQHHQILEKKRFAGAGKMN